MKALFQYIVAVSVVLTVGVADAKTVQDNTRTIKETAWVVGGKNSDKNYNVGTGSFAMQVAARGGNSDRKAYLKIDLRGLPVDGEPLEKAELDLKFYKLIGKPSGKVSFTVYGIVNSPDSWDRSAITWNTAPSNVTKSSLKIDPEGTTVLGDFSVNTRAISKMDSIVFSSEELDSFLNRAIGLAGDSDDAGGVSKDVVTLIIAASPGTRSSNAGISFYGSSTGTAGAKPELRFR